MSGWKQIWRWFSLVQSHLCLIAVIIEWNHPVAETTKALLLGRPRFVAGVEASARQLPWVPLLTSLEGFSGGPPSVVRVFGLWVRSVLSSLSLWLVSLGRTFDSLSQAQVSVGKAVPLYGTDLISVCRGWSWGKNALLLTSNTGHDSPQLLLRHLGFSYWGQLAKRCLPGLGPGASFNAGLDATPLRV